MSRKSKIQGQGYILAGRFHVDFGPEVLFNRVKFILPQTLDLVLETKHFKKREIERAFDRSIVTPFRTIEWELLVVETWSEGRFMETTWGRDHNGRRWFIVITKGNVAKTVFPGARGSRKPGTTYVRSGPVYLGVEAANQFLMERDQPSAEVEKP